MNRVTSSLRFVSAGHEIVGRNMQKASAGSCQNNPVHHSFSDVYFSLEFGVTYKPRNPACLKRFVPHIDGAVGETVLPSKGLRKYAEIDPTTTPSGFLQTPEVGSVYSPCVA